MNESASLLDILYARAESQHDEVLYTFLADGEQVEESLTYGQLYARAAGVAEAIRDLVRPGARALLLYPPSLDYIVGFWGALLAGIVPVPVYPPNLDRPNRTLPRLEAISSDAGAELVLTNAVIGSMAEAILGPWPALAKCARLATDTVSPVARGPQPTAKREDLAFLQYTSGSTGTPKGVMLSHGNLLHNSEIIASAFGSSRSSTGMVWLPPYHDMGLIGGIVQPLFKGFRVILMSPLAFLEEPSRWPRAISKYRATISGGPNFAFDLVVRKTTEAERGGWDLGAWKVAFSGAEPIRGETIARFSNAFEAAGFQKSAFHPCYGLAESTLMVTGGRSLRPAMLATFSKSELASGTAQRPGGPLDEVTLVSCGAVVGDQTLRIANPTSGSLCADGTIGEIWVTGESVASGYWNKPEVSASVFRASAPSEARSYLRTGDLGFLHGGELFVTGRMKDLIIIRGRNHYPDDLERTVALRDAALRPGCGAAFSVEHDGEERLVIVQEVDAHRLSRDGGHGVLGELVQAIRAAVVQEHEVRPLGVVLIKPRSIAKTSSGKIQRHACKAAYLAHSLEVLYAWREESREQQEDGSDPIEEGRDERTEIAWLCRTIALHAGVSRHDVLADTRLSSVGLDSLGAIQLRADIEREFGTLVPLAVLLGETSVSALAARVVEGAEREPRRATVARAAARPGARHPLSRGQLALLFLHYANPGSSAHNIARAVTVRSRFDADAFRGAVEALIERHVSLRTRFHGDDDAAYQEIGDARDVDLRIERAHDWRDVEVADYLEAAAKERFDFERRAPFRIRVLLRSQAETIVLVVAHHIIVDTWSLSVLLRDLKERCDARRLGAPAPAPAAPVAAYHEFVDFQRAALAGPRGEVLRAYWKDKLAGPPPVVELSCREGRPATVERSAALHEIEFGASLSDAIHACARAHGTTAYAFLLTAFAVVANRFTGEEDVVLGCPSSSRVRAAMVETVGYFSNVLPIRLDLSGNPAFGELLSRTMHTLTEALDHDDLPFVDIVDAANPTRTPGRLPLLRTIVTLQDSHVRGLDALTSIALNTHGVETSLGDVDLSTVALPSTGTEFDLSISVAQTRTGLTSSTLYDAALYDEGSVAAILEAWRTTLQAMVAAPRARLHDRALLAPSELRQIEDWSHGERMPTDRRPVYDAVKSHANATPVAIAVQSEERQLTYAQLDAEVEAFSNYLAAIGAGPEVVVAICLEPSPEAVVSVLSIAKVGACYVPIDPAYPGDRQRFMLEDSEAALVIGRRATLEAMDIHGVQRVFVDEPLPPLRAKERTPAKPTPPWDGASLAYVIYTSGSTGRPKGVAVTRDNLENLLTAMQCTLRLTPKDRLLAVTTMSFDIVAVELYLPLLVGATMVLCRRDVATDGFELARALESLDISFMQATPTTWRMLVEGGWRTTRRFVALSGGEALDPDLCDQLVARGALVLNGYGPTETTVYSTMGALEGSPAPVTIGRPVANTDVYLLDPRMNVVPIGVTGELYIGGKGVARGYRRRPELSNERFVPNPFVPGERLYRTGDHVRYRNDGTIEYVGRLDMQVKLRGYRIELAEIESVLRAHSQVSNAAVIVREDAPGRKQLVAYVTCPQDAADSTLQSHLSASLPAYMVPSMFVRLEKLPMTPNGKVDRNALPRPAEYVDLAPRVIAEPRDEVEAVLVGSWRDVLSRSDIGIRDHFFLVGGNSLLAMQVVARLRQAGFDVAVRDVFECSNVVALAERVRLRSSGIAETKIARREPGAAIPATFAQERMWLLWNMSPESAAYNMAAAFRLRGPLDLEALRSAFEQIVSRHEALRTNLGMRDEKVQQLVRDPKRWELPLLDMSGWPSAGREEKALDLVTSEMDRKFHLTNGMLLRTMVVRLGEGDHLLAMAMHHAVSDGWSTRLFARELQSAYRAATMGDRAAPPALAIQYGDYAVWERSAAREREIQAALAQVTTRLAACPVLALPADLAPVASVHQAASHTAAISEETAHGLARLGERYGATLFMTLLTAWKLSLHAETSQSDLVIGTAVANRHRPEIEPLIGLFVNTVAIRTELSGVQTFSQALVRVRDAVLAALEHDDVPFERVVAAIRSEREPTAVPLVRAMFLLDDAAQEPVELPSVVMDAVKLPRTDAMVDLALAISHRHEGLDAVFEYRPQALHPRAVERLAERFVATLDAVVRDPNRPVRPAKQDAHSDVETASASEDQVRAPRTQTERTLLAMFTDLLGPALADGRTFGIEDDFFRAGGHSLLAMVFVGRVLDTWGIDIPLPIVFDGPTVAKLAAYIDATASNDIPAAPGAPLVAGPRAESAPLSYAQERLWFLSQLETDSTAYNIAAALKLTGRVDEEALRRAVEQVVHRHDVLRTTFAQQDGIPVQRIHSERPWALPVIDLAGKGVDGARDWIRAQAERPFALDSGPLLMTALLRLGDTEYVLVAMMHHIVSDGWSTGVLLREIEAFYGAHRIGVSATLAPLPVQYADYAIWQRSAEHRRKLEDDLAYWKANLEESSPLALPTDRPRPPAQTFQGATHEFMLSSELIARVAEVGLPRRATAFMVLGSAFIALLHRYSGQVDICLGTPIANRQHKAIENLIGFFANTVVIRAKVDAEMTFAALLEQVRETSLEAYAHQELPFAKLVQELRPERDLSRSPLFQVMLVVQNEPLRLPRMDELSVEEFSVPMATAKFDLLVSVQMTDQGALVGFEFNTDLFDRATIERMAHHWLNLLDGATRAPDTPLARIPLMNARERDAVLRHARGPSVSWPRELVHDACTRGAAMHPRAIALEAEGGRLTYGELEERTNRLAHYLGQRGAAPGTGIGIALERGCEAIVAILATLKCGAYYVPLDPSYPREWLDAVGSDAGLTVVLASERAGESFGGAKVVDVRRLHEPLLAEPATPPAVPTTDEDLAYVLFTSGTTGRPKGVAMPHRALANLLRWQSANSRLGPGARTLQFASLGFDVSFQEIFSTLSTGGTLFVVPNDVRADPHALLRFVAEHSIERIFLPFAVLSVVAEAAVARGIGTPSLSEVVTAGEQVHAVPSLKAWFDGMPHCTLYNQYGPTEAHVVTAMALPQSTATWPPLPPIGAPIANVQVYVLDGHMDPVPFGVPGEIFIGGNALARGYLGGRGNVSAFVPDPFSSGGRLYRTGDRARLCVDGAIEFLGRRDEQVKIRGFRVEPAHVQSVLARDPEVRDVIVVVVDHASLGKRLVAYVVPRGSVDAFDVAAYRARSCEAMPDYMIPSAFVPLAALPVNVNGKVHRAKLPVPTFDSGRDYVQPTTEMERVVARVMAELLGVDAVGAQHSFFERGGHSLLATQLASRLAAAVEREVPLRAIFVARTVAELAAFLEQQAVVAPQPAIARVARKPYVKPRGK